MEGGVLKEELRGVRPLFFNMKQIYIRTWRISDRHSSNFFNEIHLNKHTGEYAICGTLSHDILHCLLGQMFGRDSIEAHYHYKCFNMVRELLIGCLGGKEAKQENIEKAWKKLQN